MNKWEASFTLKSHIKRAPVAGWFSWADNANKYNSNCGVENETSFFVATDFLFYHCTKLIF